MVVVVFFRLPLPRHLRRAELLYRLLVADLPPPPPVLQTWPPLLLFKQPNQIGFLSLACLLQLAG